jgi:hypothetical protein
VIGSDRRAPDTDVRDGDGDGDAKGNRNSRDRAGHGLDREARRPRSGGSGDLPEDHSSRGPRRSRSWRLVDGRDDRSGEAKIRAPV